MDAGACVQQCYGSRFPFFAFTCIRWLCDKFPLKSVGVFHHSNISISNIFNISMLLVQSDAKICSRPFMNV